MSEGDSCLDINCNGHYEYGRVENCSCHIAPPCSACVDNELICNVCGCTSDEIECLSVEKPKEVGE